MSFNLIKNAGIGGLLLLLVTTALWGHHSIGALVEPLTVTVEMHNPSQMALVNLNERLRTSGEPLASYLHRDRITAADVADALTVLRRRFESTKDLVNVIGEDAVLDSRPSTLGQGAFLAYIDEVESTGEQCETARQLLSRTTEHLALSGPSLASFAASMSMATAPRSLVSIVEISASALAIAESMHDRHLHREAVSFEEVAQSLTDALAFADKLKALGVRHLDDSEAMAASSASSISLQALHDAIMGARLAVFAYREEESYNADRVALRAVEQRVREQPDRVTLALLRANNVLGKRSEGVQRAVNRRRHAPATRISLVDRIRIRDRNAHLNVGEPNHSLAATPHQRRRAHILRGHLIASYPGGCAR